MPEPVIIVPYDPRWPQDFATIAALLAKALGPLALSIQHVGSTAVPGLAAKPIIDIDIVIDSDEALDRVVARLAGAGYRYEGEKGIAGRYAFTQPQGLPRHHCYVCAGSNPELLRHLQFRDALRGDPELIATYGQLKQSLAAQFGDDRVGYSDAKSEFIESVLRLS